MDDVEHQLINVFRPFLRNNLIPTDNFLSHLYASITVFRDKQEEIMAVKRQKPKSEVVDKVLDILSECNEAGWFKNVLSALKEEETPRNSHIADYIVGVRKFEDMTPYKGLLLAYGRRLLTDIIPGNIICHFLTLSTEDKDYIKRCIDREGNQRATMELIFRIQRGGDEWFKELVNALKTEGYNDLVNLLQPPDREHAEILRNPHEQMSGNPNEGNVETPLVYNPHEQIPGNSNEYNNQCGTPAQDPDKDEDTRNEKYDDERENAPEAVKELKLRDYQKKLAKPVIAGQNTIIISHTGSGKTVVAVHFVKEHFNREQASKLNVKPKKVVFLVNTISLVAQQHDVFESYMSSSLRLCQVIGDTTTQLVPIKDLIENNDIIFLTAQVLVNALQKNDVKIDDFSMLVFDECHHCHHQNPYNAIMAIYRKRKLGPERAASLPQIVGLTASVGTGRASTQDKSDEYVKSIFANLDVEAISVPDDNDDDYLLYVNPPEEIDPILVKPRPDDKDPFKTAVISIMCAIEQMLEEGVIKQDEPKLKGLLKFRDSPKGTSAYEQGVENFISHCPQVVTSPSLLRLMRTAGLHLRKYNDALKMNKICRIDDGLRYIQDFIDEEETTRSDGFNDDDRKLIKFFKEREEKLKQVSEEKQFENPLLTELESVLIKEFRKENSHAIIFCTTRATVDAMYSWIKESKRLSTFLKPEKIFGSSEMTPSEQKSVLQNFKNNECNILVGTNVVEEGTDVPACNLVFRYNYMSSDVGRKQAKGRVRAKNSKFYMVASTEFNFEGRDQANKIRDIFMMKSVRTLSQLPNDKLKEDLLVLQNIDLRERVRNEMLEREKQESRTTAEYKLLCGKCSVTACVSSDVRVFNDSNHLIINDEFYPMKVCIKKHPKPVMIFDNIQKNGKIYCKKCNHDWGVIVTIDNMNFGVIKISSFLLEKSADGKRRTCKKWKDCPFKVKQIDMIDFRTENPEWNVELPYKK